MYKLLILLLLLPLVSATPEVLEIKKENHCPIEINKTILWESYNLDASIPFFDIYTSTVDCDNVKYLRWIVRVEKDNSGFVINGIKFYWILFPFITIALLLFYLETRKTHRLYSSLPQHLNSSSVGNKL